MAREDCVKADVILKRLPSGYWHARFNANQFLQWPISSPPPFNEVFGWPLTPAQERALADALALEMSEATEETTDACQGLRAALADD